MTKGIDDTLRDARVYLGSSAMAVYIMKKSRDPKLSVQEKKASKDMVYEVLERLAVDTPNRLSEEFKKAA